MRAEIKSVKATRTPGFAYEYLYHYVHFDAAAFCTILPVDISAPTSTSRSKCKSDHVPCWRQIAIPLAAEGRKSSTLPRSVRVIFTNQQSALCRVQHALEKRLSYNTICQHPRLLLSDRVRPLRRADWSHKDLRFTRVFTLVVFFFRIFSLDAYSLSTYWT